MVLWDELNTFERRRLTKEWHAGKLKPWERPQRLFRFRPLPAALCFVPMTDEEREKKHKEAAEAEQKSVRREPSAAAVQAVASRESLAVSAPGSPVPWEDDDDDKPADGKPAAAAAAAPVAPVAPPEDSSCSSVGEWTVRNVRDWLAESLGAPKVAAAAAAHTIDGRQAQSMDWLGWLELGALPLKATEIAGAMKILPAGSCLIAAVPRAGVGGTVLIFDGCTTLLSFLASRKIVC